MTTDPNYLPDVRDQYEEFPYPPRDPEEERSRLIVPHLSRLDVVNHHCFRGKHDFNNFRVLVAGGGTGDSAILWAHQLRDRKNAAVVYLDMSKASMTVAQERARIRGLENITWINDSLLDLPKLDIGAFDFINCAGVLHHLADPDLGLKALRAVLKSDGAMNIMVYAKYGRNGIYQLQELMRLVNAGAKTQQQRIENARKILQSLPAHHVYNTQQSVHGFTDTATDAGLYDLLLHTQDRAYTILEVRDWLERCGLRMAGEPGSANAQEQYLPETFIKDAVLLKEIRKNPLKIQQAIAEKISNKIAIHEFFAVDARAEETEAQATDKHLIPCPGTSVHISFEKMSRFAETQTGDFRLNMDRFPDQPKAVVAYGKYVPALLKYMDGARSIAHIIEAVRSDAAFKSRPPAEATVLEDFKKLLRGLNRGHMATLRHKSVPPYQPLSNI